ncbi:hypothetical protein EJD97_020014 [Solanum chilense]|uniref:Uncharacterized protein n=1 Tax=Solanum chilense TaxID=4083 RepID=A0A6N2AXV8_SOLCI|nr:hypothetical protein EJD97_020014 [Solanum chilense]
MLVTVRRWQRNTSAEGGCGSITKCGVTENGTDRRSHDGSSCRFVLKIKEVALVPIFQEFMCFRNGDLDGPLCS